MGQCGRRKGDGRARPRYFTLDLEIDFGEAVEVGWIVDGHRTLAPVSGGNFEGGGLSGVVRPIGIERRLRRRRGACTASVETVLSTDDGARIALRCDGEGMERGAGERVVGRTPFRSGPGTLAVQCRFECGDARYAWLDGALAVGEAHVDVDHADYRLFAVSTLGADRPP